MQLYVGQPLATQPKELNDFVRGSFPEINREFIQPAKLRAFGIMKNNSNSVTIYFQDSKSIAKDTEVLLPTNRFFITESMSLAIALVPIVGGKLQYGDRKVVTYPYEDVFLKKSHVLPSSQETVDDSVLKSMNCFYNGKFLLKVENFDYLENSPVNMFKVDPNNRPDIVNYGHHLVDLKTTLIMSGRKEQKLVIEIPSDGDYSNIAKLNDATQLIVEVELDGYVIICSTTEKEKYVSDTAEGK